MIPKLTQQFFSKRFNKIINAGFKYIGFNYSRNGNKINYFRLPGESFVYTTKQALKELSSWKSFYSKFIN